jgi:hypothetical protein
MTCASKTKLSTRALVHIQLVLVARKVHSTLLAAHTKLRSPSFHYTTKTSNVQITANL